MCRIDVQSFILLSKSAHYFCLPAILFDVDIREPKPAKKPYTGDEDGGVCSMIVR